MYRLSRLVVFSYSNLCPKIQMNQIVQQQTRTRLCRFYSSGENAGTAGAGAGAAKKESIFQKLKSMFKDYWYVAIPVHVVTSAVWMGAFYKTAQSGLDIKKYMKFLGFSDAVIDRVGNSGAGNLAVAYAMYKIATPARYFVTVGFSTCAINILKRRGYIRTAKQISQPARDMLNKKKDAFLKNKNVKSPPANNNK